MVRLYWIERARLVEGDSCYKFRDFTSQLPGPSFRLQNEAIVLISVLTAAAKSSIDILVFPVEVRDV